MKPSLLSAFLIVCLFVQPTVPLLAQTSAGITITAMDRGSVRPFDRLVISGSGFAPATAAISVLFVPKQRGVPVVIPVHSATATQIEVIVPTFPDSTTGDYGFGQVDVQVMQVTSAQVMSSNVLSGLDVAPVPALPGSLVTGRVTREFMQLSIDALAASSGSSIDALKSELTALLAKIDAVVAKPGSAVSIPSVDSTPLSLTTPMLKASDRLIAAYLTSIAPYTRAQRLGGGNVAMAGTVCVPGDEAVIIDLCALREASFGGGRNWLGGLVAIAAGVTAIVAVGAAASALVATGLLVGGVALATAGATQFVYLAATSTLVRSVQSTDAPLLPESVPLSRQWLDHVNELGAAPIPSASITAADSISLVVREKPTATTSPRDLIVAASSLDAASPNRDVVAFLRSAAPAPLAIPSTPSVRTFAEARLAPATVALFDGNYAGSADVVSPNPLVTSALNLPVAFTVAAGTVNVTAPARGTGTVSPSGRIALTLGNCRISGFVGAKSATGAAASGGSVFCELSGETGSGPWFAHRTAR